MGDAAEVTPAIGVKIRGGYQARGVRQRGSYHARGSYVNSVRGSHNKAPATVVCALGSQFGQLRFSGNSNEDDDWIGPEATVHGAEAPW